MLIFPDWFMKAPNGDLCILALCAEQGPVALLNEVTGTYRKHAGGTWSAASVAKQCNDVRLTLDLLNLHFSGRYFKLLRDSDFIYTSRRCQLALKNGLRREARQDFWGAVGRFAASKPISLFLLGVSIYGSDRFVRVVYWFTAKIAVRTRIRRFFKRDRQINHDWS